MGSSDSANIGLNVNHSLHIANAIVVYAMSCLDVMTVLRMALYKSNEIKCHNVTTRTYFVHFILGIYV